MGGVVIVTNYVDSKSKTQKTTTESNFVSYQEQTQNVLGNEKPETYLEINGIKYYSRVDGKEISDLVKK